MAFDVSEFFHWNCTLPHGGEQNQISNLSTMWLDLLVWALLFFVICWVIFLFVRSRKLRPLLRFVEHRLFKISACIWGAGVVVYMVGCYDSGLNFLSVVPMAVVSAFMMFFGQDDFSPLNPDIVHNVWFMMAYSLVHFMAILVMALVLIRFVGFRLNAYIDLKRYAKRCNKTGGVINIFWGTNEASYVLAESIKRKGKNEQNLFVDVALPEESDKESLAVKYDRILDIISFRGHEVNRLQELGALITTCKYDIVQCEPKPGEGILDVMRMRHLSKIVKAGSEVRFFFLSNNANNNILSAQKLLQDDSIKKSDRVKIYVHAHKSYENKIYDNYSQYQLDEMKAKLKLIDSSYLAVAALKTDASTHPVTLFDVEQGAVNGELNSMIIGFGETGQELFKYMYEFGALVDAEGKKIPFKCCAIDHNMAKYEGLIRTNMPLVSNEELELVNLSIDTIEFWQKVTSQIETLNYIFIAINDDQEALSLAVKLYQLAMQRRGGDLRSLRIFIRNYDASRLMHMRDVTSNIVENMGEYGGVMQVFGDAESIYDYDLIISEKRKQDAKLFHYHYSKDKVGKTIDEHWENSYEEEKAINGFMEKNSCSRLTAIESLNVLAESNISNSLHIPTKLYLLGLTEDDERVKMFYDIMQQRKDKHILYPTADPAMQQMLINVAKCEHERWNAAQILAGFRRGDTKNYVRKTHPSLCPWEELSEMTQAYDCDVVDTSVKIVLNRNKKQDEQ